MYCNNCGAENAQNAKFCRQCGATLTQPVQVNPTGFPDLVNYKANYYINSFINQGGNLNITPTQIIFRPHAFNFGSMKPKVFEIKDIVGYKKGALTYLTISFANGKIEKFNVWKKDEIIRQLEMRKEALLKK